MASCFITFILGTEHFSATHYNCRFCSCNTLVHPPNSNFEHSCIGGAQIPRGGDGRKSGREGKGKISVNVLEGLSSPSIAGMTCALNGKLTGSGRTRTKTEQKMHELEGRGGRKPDK